MQAIKARVSLTSFSRKKFHTFWFDSCISSDKVSNLVILDLTASLFYRTSCWIWCKIKFVKLLLNVSRALETASHIFGPPRKPGVPTFLADRFEKTNLPRPQFLVREECRERFDFNHFICGAEFQNIDRGTPSNSRWFWFNHTLLSRWGHYTCDGRRPISEIQKEFPDCDFSEVRPAGAMKTCLLIFELRLNIVMEWCCKYCRLTIYFVAW